MNHDTRALLENVNAEDYQSYISTLHKKLDDLPAYLSTPIKCTGSYMNARASSEYIPIVTERLLVLFATMIECRDVAASEVFTDLIVQIDLWVSSYLDTAIKQKQAKQTRPDTLRINISPYGILPEAQSHYSFNEVLTKFYHQMNPTVSQSLAEEEWLTTGDTTTLRNQENYPSDLSADDIRSQKIQQLNKAYDNPLNHNQMVSFEAFLQSELDLFSSTYEKEMDGEKRHAMISYYKDLVDIKMAFSYKTPEDHQLATDLQLAFDQELDRSIQRMNEIQSMRHDLYEKIKNDYRYKYMHSCISNAFGQAALGFTGD